MKKAALLAALAVCCSAAQALPLDDLSSCTLSTRDFFAHLVQAQAIQTPAFKVGTSGLNLFKKSANDSLTFFGMTVGVVVGYADDPLFFQRAADGSTPAYEGYGFYVSAPPSAVAAALHGIGATAPRLSSPAPNVTLLTCEFPK
jgi:hypothetical protein